MKFIGMLHGRDLVDQWTSYEFLSNRMPRVVGFLQILVGIQGENFVQIPVDQRKCTI
jgi:hypothetical protein